MSWTSLLRPYQLEAAQWLTDLPFGARARILADGLGTGKSFSGLASQRLRYELGRMDNPCGLVFAPGVALHDWRRTAEVLWPEAFVHVFGTEPTYRRRGESAEEFEARRNSAWQQALRGEKGPSVLIGDYAVAEKLDNFLTENSILIDSLIIDEAHALKRASTKRSKIIRGLVARCRATTLLTGTPIHNRPYDLYNLLTLCRPNQWGSLYTWAGRYFNLRQGNNGIGTVIDELLDKDKLIADTRDYIMGRSATELMGQLPGEQRVLKLVDVPGVARISPAKAARLKTGSELDKALRSAVQYKLDAAVELALDVDRPVVLYAYRREDAQALAKRLTKAGVTATLATGDLSVSARDRAIEAWKQGGSTALVCTMDAVRESATLTRADVTIFVDLSWLPGTILQCEGRTAPSRQPAGNRRPVTYYYVVTRDGPDEVVAESIIEKLSAASGIGAPNPKAEALAEALKPLDKKSKPEENPQALLEDLGNRMLARAQRLAALGLLA